VLQRQLESAPSFSVRIVHTVTTPATSTSVGPVAALGQADVARVVDQAVQVLELPGEVGGRETGTLMHTYETEPASQHRATLKQIYNVEPGSVTYDEFAEPNGINTRSAGCTVSRQPANGLPLLEHRAATTGVSPAALSAEVGAAVVGSGTGYSDHMSHYRYTLRHGCHLGPRPS
jgi:hypothetical protein